MDIHDRVQGAEENLSPEEWEAAEAHAAGCPGCADILGLGPPPPRISPGARTGLLTLASLALLLLLGAFFKGSETVEASEESLVALPRRPAEEVERLAKASEESLDEATGEYGTRVGGVRSLRLVGGGGGTEAPPVPAIPFQEGRKLIRNANVDIEVEGYDGFQKALAERVAEAKGYLADETRRKLPNGKTEATLTLRIPPEGFEGFLRGLAALGTIRQQNVKSEDVTKAYLDLEARMRSKETLAERLRAVLAGAKGEVQELVEAESRLAGTLEQIEQIKGEIKYYEQLTRYATVVLRIAEKDLQRPFEYVETLAGRMILKAPDPEEAFARAQQAVVDAGGRVVEARLARGEEAGPLGTLRARIDADKYAGLRTSIRALGHPVADQLERRKTPQGGDPDAHGADAPLRKSLATLDLTVSGVPAAATRRISLTLETAGVDGAYESARAAVEAAQGRVLDGGLSGDSGRARATLKIELDAERAAALLERLRELGTVRGESAEHAHPASGPVRERARVELSLSTPAPLIAEEHGAVRALRETVAGSWSGFLWSLERIFVGAALATPWAAVGLLAWAVYSRRRRLSASSAGPSA